MSQNNELLQELENQIKDAEANFKMYVNKLSNKALKMDMLDSFEKIKTGELSTVELTNKAKEWQLNSDK